MKGRERLLKKAERGKNREMTGKLMDDHPSVGDRWKGRVCGHLSYERVGATANADLESRDCRKSGDCRG